MLRLVLLSLQEVHLAKHWQEILETPRRENINNMLERDSKLNILVLHLGGYNYYITLLWETK